jgi:YVTN family beta-propeller protein
MRQVPDVQRERHEARRWVAIASSVLTVAAGLVFTSASLGTPVALAAGLAPTAYVTDSNGNVTSIDTTTNTAASATIGVGGSPFGIAISPDGTKAYTADSGSNTVTPINTADDTTGTAIDVGGAPRAIAFSPDGTVAYVANSASGSVTPINTTTDVAGAEILVGGNPYGVAFSPDGLMAYVTSPAANTVTSINTADNTAGPPITVGGNPYGVAFSPDGNTAYVTNVGAGTVTPINVSTNTPGSPIPVGLTPTGVAFSPDGTVAYVTNFSSDSVTAIAVSTNDSLGDITVGSAPSTVAFSPDGTMAYVTNGGANTVTVIDASTNTPVADITVGPNPWGVAFVPDQAPVAAFSTSGTLTPGSTIAFDASASTTDHGTIASYAWDFGDGTTGSGVTTSHVYHYGAAYNPTLTVTNSVGTSTTKVFTGQTMSRNGGPSAKVAHGLNIAGTRPLAYATLNDWAEVAPINAATNTAETRIAVGQLPEAIAISPDGSTAYVVNTGSNSVTPIDTVTNVAGDPIPVGAGPQGVAFSPNGNIAYVTNYQTGTVTPITVSTNTPGTEFPVGPAPYSVAFTPDGTKAYVANNILNSVTPIDVATTTAGNPIPVGRSPLGIAISPDGTKVYVANSSSDTVTPITIATDLPGPEIPVGQVPFGLAFSPDGTKAYVANFISNTVTSIDVATNSPIAEFPAGPMPTDVAFSPDGTSAYVTDYGGGSVTAIDVATGTLGTAIAVGLHPYAVAFVPDQAPVATFTTSGTMTSGATISFDASASTVMYGTIANYAWDFGDGTDIVNTNVPTTSHLYSLGGSYTARVIETSSAGTSTERVFTGQTMSRNGGPSAVATSLMTIASTPTVETDPPALRLSLQREPAQPVADATVVVSGEGLMPASGVRIEMESPAVLLGTDATDGNGAFETTAQMPHVVSPGTHTLTAFGIGPEGDPIERSVEFFVDWSGSLGEVRVSGGYTAVTATRILDTRDGQSLAAATELRLLLPAALVPADVSSLVLNVTVTDAVVGGYLTIYPCGSARPLAAAVNFAAGETRANLVDAMLVAGGALCLWSNVDIDAIVDLQGFHSESGSGRLVPGTAVRLVDTRPDSALVADQVLQVPVVGGGRAPASASTVTLNVTVVDPESAGFLTVYRCGTDRPWASNLNFVDGQTVGNEVMVQPGTDGMVCVYTTAATHLVVDLDATFEAGGIDVFSTLVPGRFADTRVSSKVLAGETMEWSIVGDDRAPNGTTALSMNVAVSDPEGGGYLTVYPCGAPMPVASNLNFVDGQTASNHVTASLGDDGGLCVFASRTTNLVIDIEGLYSHG